MKTLEELVKDLGLKPALLEQKFGRSGNYVVVYKDNTYSTHIKNHVPFVKENDDFKKVIKVKH